jgi:segregation and condensation protein B
MEGEVNPQNDVKPEPDPIREQWAGDGSGEDQDLAGPPPLPIKAMIESLLFVADEPVQLERLGSVLGTDAGNVQAALQELAGEYERQRGIRLQFTRNRVQMVTAPEATEVVRRYLGLELDGKLSPAALETLAIVAYRQPVTRAQVEAIRGVNSDSVLRTLINRGLIDELGRLDQAGRPIIYGTSFEFLQQFGLSSLEELPTLDPSGILEPGS